MLKSIGLLLLIIAYGAYVINGDQTHSVAVDVLNLRSSPSGEIVGTIPRGATVRIVYSDGGWGKLDDGTWVSMKFLDPNALDTNYIALSGLILWSYIFYRWRTKKRQSSNLTRESKSENTGRVISRLDSFYDLCILVLEDQRLTKTEATQLKRWCELYPEEVRSNVYLKEIDEAMQDALADDRLKIGEKNDILYLLNEFCSHLEGDEAIASSNKREKYSSGKIDVGESFLLEYRDGAGAESRREIKVTNAGPTYLEAYCKMRKGVRTFRVDRIVSLVNKDTGESVH
jgi:hypothetical protein